MGQCAGLIARIAARVLKLLLCWLAGAQQVPEEELQSRWRRARRVLILSGAGIGDALMATPLVVALQQRRPDIQIAVVTHERAAAVFAAYPNLLVLSYRERQRDWVSFLQLLWRCWQFRADIFLGAQPANTIRHSLIAAASRARIRLKHAYDYGSQRERDFSCLYHRLLPNQTDRHRVELNLDLLRILGEDIPAGVLRPLYPLSEAALHQARASLPQHRPCVALHPGSGRPDKRWGRENFLTVARWLVEHGYAVVVLGSAEEYSEAESIVQALGGNAYNWAGRTTLEQTAALLHCCRLLLSNDSGIMHLATAVGTPVVAIFVTTNPAHIGPYAPNATVVRTGEGIPPNSAEVLRVLQQCLQAHEHGNAGS